MPHPQEIKEAFSRRARMKKRGRTDIMGDKLRLYEKLQSSALHGVLVDAAVWLICSDATVQALDHICLGNLDGGPQMLTHIKNALEQQPPPQQPTGVQQQQQQQPVDCSHCTAAVRLSCEEAFFMHYALAALDLHELDLHDASLPISKLDTATAWRRFAARRPDFPLLYAAYQHFRGKGWLARTGLQYGADFTLYQKHPALCHSDYSVLVQTPDMTDPRIARPPLSWHDMQITNRLTTQVGKRLVLVNIHDARADGGGYAEDYRCLDRLEVSEYLVRRYVPERHRG